MHAVCVIKYDCALAKANTEWLTAANFDASFDCLVVVVQSLSAYSGCRLCVPVHYGLVTYMCIPHTGSYVGCLAL